MYNCQLEADPKLSNFMQNFGIINTFWGTLYIVHCLIDASLIWYGLTGVVMSLQINHGEDLDI